MRLPEAKLLNEMEDPDAKDAIALSQKVGAMFEGQHPAVVGAALIEVTAKWVWGHVVPDKPKATHAARQTALQLHLQAVWKMIDLYDKIAAEEARKLQ